jgi:formylglycine-generating enzyme required for sulfatase activity
MTSTSQREHTLKLNLEFVEVPAGEFVMGSDPRAYRAAGADEMPQHRLEVGAFQIMRFPVTNEQFHHFMQASGHRAPLTWKGVYPADKADHPVVGVTYQDALAFCRWAREVTELPLRMPTEAEWEKAARGTEGHLYPWGDAWQPGLCANREGKAKGTAPVSSHSPQGDSPYGVAETAGNVSEWCSSLFGPYPYDPLDGREARINEMESATLFPKQHDAGAIANAERSEANLGKQCLRGGSWRGDRNEARCAYRSWAAPMHRSDDTGFRCCYE